MLQVARVQESRRNVEHRVFPAGQSGGHSLYGAARTPAVYRQVVDREFSTWKANYTKTPYSHSIVAGGLPEMSYTTRLMPRTSLMMRLEILPSSACGSSAQCAVMKSCVCTARNATTHS